MDTRKPRLIALGLVALAVLLTFGPAVPVAEAALGCCQTCLQAYYACSAACGGDPACDDACWNTYLQCIPACPRQCPY